MIAPVQKKQLDERVKLFLLEVQSALQNHHVKEEQYPVRSMTGMALVGMLVKEEFLPEDLISPWTGQSYLRGSPEDDWLRCRFDESGDSYELITFLPGTEKIHYQLDSSENQSLEGK